jgi:uncharacterized membrane protein
MSEPRPANSPPVLYDAELAPHCSLPPRGFAVLMLVLAGANGTVGMAFVLRGAWPVTPFFGLDLLLVYLAFRMSYRQARRREALRLTEENLTVERTDPKGGRRHWHFHPFWLRVVLEEKDEHSNRLVLASHGRSLVVGSFLGPDERRDVARDLTDALGRWKARLPAGRDA